MDQIKLSNFLIGLCFDAVSEDSCTSLMFELLAGIMISIGSFKTMF